MLKQRIITALLLLPAFWALLFWFSPQIFIGLIAVVIYLLALEWAFVSGVQSQKYRSLFALSVSLLNLALWFGSANLLDWRWPGLTQLSSFDIPGWILLLSLAAIGLGILMVANYSDRPGIWKSRYLRLLQGSSLLTAFFVSLVSLRGHGFQLDSNYGSQLILLMFCLIWGADTGAFFTGKLFGKHKLAPQVSPNKTWEGALGGVFLSSLVAIVGALVLQLNITVWWLYGLIALGLAVLSVMGDLLESALKRTEKIKDSGRLLPGHGGLLDRLDSSLVVAPCFLLVFSEMGWI